MKLNKADYDSNPFFANRSKIKTTELLGFLETIYPGSNEATRRWHIYKLKEQRLLKQLGRGLYKLKDYMGQG